MILQQIKQQIE